MSFRSRTRSTQAIVRVVLAAALGMLAVEAHADDITFESAHTATSCLVTPARETLQYPRGQAEKKVGGVIRVRLSFTAPDKEPRVEVFYDTVGDRFRAAVLEFVSGYRLPCLVADVAPVAVTQEFEFNPGDGRKVMWSGARDDTPVRTEFGRCTTGAEWPPVYPSSAMRANEEGTVLARLTFVDSVSPPKVEIVYDGGSLRLARAVEGYVSGYRLPCLKTGDAPIIAVQQFRFAIDGNRRVTLSDAPLSGFLRAVDKIEAQHVRFDFNTMGCPFQVRFLLRQPYFNNVVGEIEHRDPNRREFVEWLKHVDLKLSDKDRHLLIGDSMTISVPCTVLDLL